MRRGAWLALILVLAASTGSAQEEVEPVFPPPERVNEAVRRLGDDAYTIREAASRDLLAWGLLDPGKLLPLLPSDDPDPEIRARLEELRSRISVDRRLMALLAVAADSEPMQAAARGLSEHLADPAFLAPAADSPTRLPETDGVLTPFLTSAGTEKSKAVRMMEILLADKDLAVRRIAARILYYHGTAENVPAVRKSLGDADAYIRACGAQALAKIGDRESASLIAALLKDPERDARQGAALALGQVGSPEQVTALEALLEDPDEGVRKAVEGALAQIAGRKPTPPGGP